MTENKLILEFEEETKFTTLASPEEKQKINIINLLSCYLKTVLNICGSSESMFAKFKKLNIEQTEVPLIKI